MAERAPSCQRVPMFDLATSKGMRLREPKRSPYHTKAWRTTSQGS